MIKKMMEKPSIISCHFSFIPNVMCVRQGFGMGPIMAWQALGRVFCTGLHVNPKPTITLHIPYVLIPDAL